MNENVCREERSFSKGLIETNPKLFASRVDDFIEKHPSSEWSLRFRHSEYPGEWISLVAIRKP